jgi:SAM-dependent methyltransferase
MVDFAAGRRLPVWLRVVPGRRLPHELATYFAPVTAHERALLDMVEGPVLDVGCGPARHARLLQARGLTAIGLDRSPVVLGLARSLKLGGGGLRRRPRRARQGELRLIAGAGGDAAAGTHSRARATPTRLLASGLDGPTGVARLPDGRWVVAESGHTRLTILGSKRP